MEATKRGENAINPLQRQPRRTLPNSKPSLRWTSRSAIRRWFRGDPKARSQISSAAATRIRPES